MVWLQLAVRQWTGCRGIPFATSGNPSDPNFNVDLSGFTADQEFQAGMTCSGVHPTPFVALPSSCPGSQFSSTLATVPAPGTENDDRNPPRIAPRHLFDISA